MGASSFHYFKEPSVLQIPFLYRPRNSLVKIFGGELLRKKSCRQQQMSYLMKSQIYTLPPNTISTISLPNTPHFKNLGTMITA